MSTIGLALLGTHLLFYALGRLHGVRAVAKDLAAARRRERENGE